MMIPANIKAVNKTMGFLAKRLVVQSIVLGEEQFMVEILVDAIPRGPQG